MNQSASRAPHVPERIQGLAGLATNLTWSWDRGARALFRMIDEPLWHLTRHNPIDLLQRVGSERLAALARDPEFLGRYDAVWEAFVRDTSSSETWFASTYPDLAKKAVAYFCAEFALHNSVPIYSGGLGILAGDHCKAASDLGVPLVGVGLFYTKGFFDQRVRLDGWQEDSDAEVNPALTPLIPILGPGGAPHLTTVRMLGREVRVGAWRMMVGRVPVYLLDTDLESNDFADRELTHRLYAGGVEFRLRQEWILGLGGVRALRALGIDPVAWHANEGHSAFMFLERLRELRVAGMPVPEAIRRVRASSVFTTHTPVPAGHDVFTADQLEHCAGAAWEELGVSREEYFRFGFHPQLDHRAFHMTALAIRFAARVNGVSERHGRETRRIWQSLWPGREDSGVPIGHLTNGVHLATWMAHRIREVLDAHLSDGWADRATDLDLWDRVLSLDEDLWRAHLRMKAVLMDFIHEQARLQWRDEWREAAHLVGAGTLLNSRVMTIGFARRFAGYKRGDLIFRDLERLRRLVTSPQRPVQIIFAGKAHPADHAGKRVLQRVYSFTRDPRFEGRIAFVEDYELHLAHRLVQGVDLWLNLPTPPLEACGTSGMKAALNGVPQVSTLDGWWAEGYNGQNGWAIPPAPDGADIDAHDAEHLYTLLEEQVVPLFYSRDARGVPVGWLERMKHALHAAGRSFTAQRMVHQYVTEYYVPAACGEPAFDDPPIA